MRIRFTKMEGLGNDFVVIDGLRQSPRLSSETIRRLADRHFGIGFDQLLLVEAPSHAGADFCYRIFNADGSEVAQCGNGARCFARFVVDQGLFDGDTIRVETRSGPLVLTLMENSCVRVDMGVPRHAPAAIPLEKPAESKVYELEVDGQPIPLGAVSMGNPHLVIEVDAIDEAPVRDLGARLESHPAVPERANVGFFEVVNRHEMRLRVFERGVGETLACGSGACAAAVIGIEWGRVESPVKVTLPGGTLQVAWSGRGHSVFLTGPARRVFDGEVDL